MAPRQVEEIETDLATDGPVELTPTGGTPLSQIFKCCLPMTPLFTPTGDSKNKNETFDTSREQAGSEVLKSSDESCISKQDNDSNAPDPIDFDVLPELGNSESSDDDSQTAAATSGEGLVFTAQQVFLMGFFQIILSFLNTWSAPFNKKALTNSTTAEYGNEKSNKNATDVEDSTGAN